MSDERYLPGERIADAWKRRQQSNQPTSPITEQQKNAQKEYWANLYKEKPEPQQANLEVAANWFNHQWHKNKKQKSAFSPHYLYEVLLHYAAAEPTTAAFTTAIEGRFMNLDKGVAIIGDLGVGKSTLLKSLRQMPKDGMFFIHNGYSAYIDASDFAMTYQLKGIEAVNDIRKKDVLFIDDVGNEPLTLFMGNRYPVIGEILKYRYENNLVTHFTANKLPSELAEMYGGRVEDRIKEMCNILWWAGGSKR